jgi:hypothetical protein
VKWERSEELPQITLLSRASKHNKCSLTPLSKEPGHTHLKVSRITSQGIPPHLNFRSFEVGLLRGAICNQSVRGAEPHEFPMRKYWLEHFSRSAPPTQKQLGSLSFPQTRHAGPSLCIALEPRMQGPRCALRLT